MPCYAWSGWNPLLNLPWHQWKFSQTHPIFSLNASTPIVPLNTKLTVPRNSILDPQFSKTSRIKARVEFRDVRVEYEDAFKSFRASPNEETKEFLRD